MANFDFPELDIIAEKLDRLHATVSAIDPAHPLPLWMTLEDCCALANVKHGTIKNHKRLLPPVQFRRKVGSRYQWPRTIALRWASMDDDERIKAFESGYWDRLLTEHHDDIYHSYADISPTHT